MDWYKYALGNIKAKDMCAFQKWIKPQIFGQPNSLTTQSLEVFR